MNPTNFQKYNQLEFKTKKNCRLCGSKNLKKVIDFGLMPLAGGFLKKEEIKKEKKYPLRMFICESCGLVQSIDVISAELLFKDYRYASSTTKTLREHFKKYAKEMTTRFLKQNSFIVEIGSNDGVFLAPLKEFGINALGVDPAINIVKIAKKKGLNVINDFFNLKTAKLILKKHGKADAIFSNNTLAHIDDMDETMKGIKLLLDKKGILVFEVQYLADLVKYAQYDLIYHEHLCYYSLKPLIKFLDRYGMQIFDIKRVPTQGGSIRVYVADKSNQKYQASKKFLKMLKSEKRMDLYTHKGLRTFTKKITKHKEALMKILKKIKAEGKTISGYGASGRSVILTNCCGIDKGYLEYMIDASPERYNRLMPGTHLKIMPPSYLRKNPTDVVLITAWTYKDEILNKEKWFLKKGGKIIIPLPKIITL